MQARLTRDRKSRSQVYRRITPNITVVGEETNTRTGDRLETEMSESRDGTSVADILGPWIEPDWDSGLIARCREAWHKPLRELTREELATFLRQRIAVAQLLPVAQKKLADGEDDTELFDGELQEAIEYASKDI